MIQSIQSLFLIQYPILFSEKGQDETVKNWISSLTYEIILLVKLDRFQHCFTEKFPRIDYSLHSQVSKCDIATLKYHN